MCLHAILAFTVFFFRRCNILTFESSAPEPENWQEGLLMLLRLSEHPLINVVVRAATEKRLNGTCFRGQPVERAGNFATWTSVGEVLSEPAVRELFLEEVLDLPNHDLEEEGLMDLSFTIELDHSIGWTSTEAANHFTKLWELEIFAPNRHSFALRVNPKASVRKAPPTSFVTFVCECKKETDGLTVIIHSLYPGDDIGPLDGDLLSRERVVFYSWDHPGEPIARKSGKSGMR